MKSLVMIFCLALALGFGIAAGCGPKNKYCAYDEIKGGECFTNPDAGMEAASEQGMGDAIIVGLGGSSGSN